MSLARAAAAVQQRVAVFLMEVVVVTIGRRLGFDAPSASNANVCGSVWYSTDYIYGNHWRPGVASVRIEPIQSKPTPWYSWLLNERRPQLFFCAAACFATVLWWWR